MRDKILIWLWPSLFYKLTTTFSDDEVKALGWIVDQLPPGRLHNLLCQVRMKVNPLRERFYSGEVKKEWGV